MVFVMITIAIILLIISWVVSIYNKLVTKRMAVREAFSTMDIYLKKRFDLIPNLVEVAKGYMKHEEETFTKIAELRSSIGASKEPNAELEQELSNTISRLLMVTENYPELKADTQFVNLQKELVGIEADIEKSRRYYNGTVKSLNTLVNLMPTNIIANMFNIKEEPFFEVEDKKERENVKINFN